MRRMLEAAGQDIPKTKPIFELNPDHVLVKKLEAMPEDADATGSTFEDWCRLLFDQAILSESGRLADPGKFVSRLNHFLENV